MRGIHNALIFALPIAAVLAACAGDKGDDTEDPVDDTGDTDTDDRVDQDGDGFYSDEDCDDLDASVYPGADEECDGIDNDCDDEIDEGVTSTYYYDGDGDGFGDPDNWSDACEALTDYVPNANDCDDDESTVYPGAEELCDGIDNNCDGVVDEDLSSATWYADTDGDGVGDPDNSIEACEQPTDYVDNSWDCDDSDPGEPVYVSQTGATWGGPGPDTGDTAVDTGTGGEGSADDPFMVIQDGIDASDECVLVFPGTYNENINFGGKDISVSGVKGTSSTIIEGTGDGSVVTFASGESAAASLSGFTITGGTGTMSEDSTTTVCGCGETCLTTVTSYMGGGLYINDSSPTLSDLRVTSNSLPPYSYTTVSSTEDMYVYSWGGGAYFGNSSSMLTRVWVDSNYADQGGGSYSDSDSSLQFEASGFEANSAASGGGMGNAGTVTMSNGIFVNNSSADSGVSYGGAGVDSSSGVFQATNVSAAGNDGLASMYLGSSATANLLNSIVVENADGAILDGDSGAALSISYSDIFNSLGSAYGSAFSDMTGTDGNIGDDPLFVAWSDDGDYSNDDLNLASGSPAIDAGNPTSTYNDTDGSTNDMGAYGGPGGGW